MANLNAEELAMLISKDNVKEKSSQESGKIPDWYSIDKPAGQIAGELTRGGIENVGKAVKPVAEGIGKGMSDFFSGLFGAPENPEQLMAQSMLPAFQEASTDAARNLAQNPQAFFGAYHQLAGMAGPTINQQALKQGTQSYEEMRNPESIMQLPKGLLTDTTGELASEEDKSQEGLRKAGDVMTAAKQQAAEFGGKPEKGVMGHVGGALGRFFGTPGSEAALAAARGMGAMPGAVAASGYAGQMPLTTYEQAQLGQQAQFKQAEQYGAATERMTNLLKATQPYSFPFLRPFGLTSQAEKTALGQLYGTEQKKSGLVKKYGEEISKIGESKVEKLRTSVPPAAVAEAKRRGLLKGAKN